VKQPERTPPPYRGPYIFTFEDCDLSKYGLGFPGTVLTRDPRSGHKTTKSLHDLRCIVEHREKDRIFLTFKSNESWGHRFVMRLYVRNGPHVQVAVPGYSHESIADVFDSLYETRGNDYSGKDRVTKALKSGKSISVALKRGQKSDYQICKVEITINPEGKARWPVERLKISMFVLETYIVKAGVIGSADDRFRYV